MARIERSLVVDALDALVALSTTIASGTFTILQTGPCEIKSILVTTTVAAGTDITVELWDSTGDYLLVPPSTAELVEGPGGATSAIFQVDVAVLNEMTSYTLRATLSAGTGDLTAAKLVREF